MHTACMHNCHAGAVPAITDCVEFLLPCLKIIVQLELSPTPTQTFSHQIWINWKIDPGKKWIGTSPPFSTPPPWHYHCCHVCIPCIVMRCCKNTHSTMLSKTFYNNDNRYSFYNNDNRYSLFEGFTCIKN